MPRVLAFANGMQSRGDGFIKSPSSGMWQCTLTPDALAQGTTATVTEKRDGASRAQSESPLASLASQTASAKHAQLLERQEALFLKPQIPLFPRQFQLISTSSMYLCSILLAARPSPLSEVQIIRLQSISSGTGLPEGVDVAFASATEATWADVISFLQQSPTCFVAEATRTAVWRLQWLAPADSGLDVGAAFLWRVTAVLPLCEQVQDTCQADQTLFIAVAAAKGVPRTPRGRMVPVSTEPPPLPPKQARSGKSAGTLPPRDLSAELAKAQEEDVDNVAVPNDATPVSEAAGSAVIESSNVRQPTYAEVLKRGTQRWNSRGAKPAGEFVREWRERLTALRVELHRSACADAALLVARGQLSKQHQPHDAGRGGAVAALSVASLKELLCNALLDVAACQTIAGCKRRGVAALLRECGDTARVVGNELEKRVAGAPALQFPKYVLQLRLVRHRLCAAALSG
ncbi:hypothetical protein DQ04_14351000, partial [Trypanosoma grayi]|uniref:hypothetical protein n=1 Tax=Trypanosoma grayi TaxID=71804 RepID=UPI0004F430CD